MLESFFILNTWTVYVSCTNFCLIVLVVVFLPEMKKVCTFWPQNVTR